MRINHGSKRETEHCPCPYERNSSFHRQGNCFSSKMRGMAMKNAKITLNEVVKRILCSTVLVLLSTFVISPVLAAPSEVGVVLMHGKWGSPQGMLPLARDLESEGYIVSNAEMSWSGRRLYDVDYPTALKEIEQQVRQLRAKGAKQVVVAGQSMGSNAAVAYASSGFDLDGLIILSPGHFPEGGMGQRLRSSFERARRMVAENRGAEAESFDDINQGKQRSIRVTASIYVSYFDPDGLGAITKNIKKLSKAMPVLLVIGTTDPFYPESKGMFDSAPPHPLSRYVALESDHFNVPKVVSAELLKWLKSFAQ
jgi:esterase/lipase